MGELNDILHELESSLGPLSGEPAPLEGGITNRNYRVTLGGCEYVVRRPGKDTAMLGIDRGAERLANAAAAELDIAPQVLGEHADCLVTRFIPCSSMSEAEVAAAIEEIALALRAFHQSPLSLPADFWVPDLLAGYAEIVAARGGALVEGYALAVNVAGRVAAALAGRERRPCHNDLLAGNIIRAQAGAVMIVDWEYAGMGDPRFDLGNLSVNNSFAEEDDERLLRAYIGAPPSDEQRAALKLMRVLSDAREGAWGAVQVVLSEIEFDFEGYAREHFERLDATVAEPDFEEWLAAAAARPT
jgi:thiamine kinase-like enzyme